MTFMFGVLGSVTFWAMYFALSVFAVPLILKHISTEAFNYVTKNGGDYFEGLVSLYVLLTIAVFIFWPVFAVVAAIWLIASKLFWSTFCSIITKANSMTPTITFGKQKQDEEETEEKG